MNKLSYAKTAHISMYGRIESGWRVQGDQIEVNFLVPENTTAEVVLLGALRVHYTENSRLNDVLDDETATAVLKKHKPEIFAGPFLGFMKKSTLKQMAENAMANPDADARSSGVLPVNIVPVWSCKVLTQGK